MSMLAAVALMVLFAGKPRRRGRGPRMSRALPGKGSIDHRRRVAVPRKRWKKSRRSRGILGRL
jgi:hypothetical protein